MISEEKLFRRQLEVDLFKSAFFQHRADVTFAFPALRLAVHSLVDRTNSSGTIVIGRAHVTLIESIANTNVHWSKPVKYRSGQNRTNR